MQAQDSEQVDWIPAWDGRTGTGQNLNRRVPDGVWSKDDQSHCEHVPVLH